MRILSLFPLLIFQFFCKKTSLCIFGRLLPLRSAEGVFLFKADPFFAVPFRKTLFIGKSVLGLFCEKFGRYLCELDLRCGGDISVLVKKQYNAARNIAVSDYRKSDTRLDFGIVDR